MADTSPESAKTRLRSEADARRRAIPADFRKTSAAAIARHFFDAVPIEQAQVVAGYWPIRDEIDTQAILLQLMQRGQAVCLPVVRGQNEKLDFRLWEEGAALYPSGFGILAPAETAPVAIPDIVLMPLLGFDRLGTRLGYGGGYYDRTLGALAQKPLLIGLAFAAQEFPRIPRETHDHPLDMVITENGARPFGERAF